MCACACACACSARVCVGAHVSTRIESGLLFFLFDNSRTTAVMALHSNPKRCESSNVTRSMCVVGAGMFVGGVPYCES